MNSTSPITSNIRRIAQIINSIYHMFRETIENDSTTSKSMTSKDWLNLASGNPNAFNGALERLRKRAVAIPNFGDHWRFQ